MATVEDNLNKLQISAKHSPPWDEVAGGVADLVQPFRGGYRGCSEVFLVRIGTGDRGEWINFDDSQVGQGGGTDPHKLQMGIKRQFQTQGVATLWSRG